MGEPIKQGLRKDSWFLLLAAAVATLAVIAFVAQAAYAEHGGPHVKIVPSDNPVQDLSIAPLVLLNTGDRGSIDFLIELPPATAGGIYATEFHIAVDGFFGPQRPLRPIDAEPETPGLQLAVSGDGLALTDMERLRLTIVGFPDDGFDLRGCSFDPNPPAGDDSLYTFIKGATGDDTNIQLELLDMRHRTEWGSQWCGRPPRRSGSAWAGSPRPLRGTMPITLT